jgi:hypothetical protein
MMPLAVVSHLTDKRMRLKISSRRGDASFFDLLNNKITAAFPSLTVQVNAITGSLLLTGAHVDPDGITYFGRTEKLFEVVSEPSKNAMALSIPASMQAANHRIGQITGGRVDLPGALFISLVIFGVIELMRGNWRTPPWYTAFWYAFGLYSKSLLEHPFAAPESDIDGD